MKKLENTSPLFDIVKRINELIDFSDDNNSFFTAFRKEPELDGVEELSFVKSTGEFVKKQLWKPRAGGVYSFKLVEPEEFTVTLTYEDVTTKREVKKTLSKDNLELLDTIMLPESTVLIEISGNSTNTKLQIQRDKTLLEAITLMFGSITEKSLALEGLGESAAAEYKKLLNTIQEFQSSVNIEALTEEEIENITSVLGG